MINRISILIQEGKADSLNMVSSGQKRIKMAYIERIL